MNPVFYKSVFFPLFSLLVFGHGPPGPGGDTRLMTNLCQQLFWGDSTIAGLILGISLVPFRIGVFEGFQGCLEFGAQYISR